MQEVHELKGLVVGMLEMIKDNQSLNPLGEWISEADAQRITGLSASSLLRLRKAGKVRASFLSQRHIFYRIDDIQLLLEKNMKLK